MRWLGFSLCLLLLGQSPALARMCGPYQVSGAGRGVHRIDGPQGTTLVGPGRGLRCFHGEVASAYRIGKAKVDPRTFVVETGALRGQPMPTAWKAQRTRRKL